MDSIEVTAHMIHDLSKALAKIESLEARMSALEHIVIQQSRDPVMANNELDELTADFIRARKEEK